MKKGFKDFLFGGWHDWSSYVGKAIVGVLKCLFSIVYAIVMGVLSVLLYLCKQIKRIVMAYPIATLAILCVGLAISLLFTYVSFAAKLKTCQMERDSMAYEKMKIEQAFVGDTIVIRGYTKQHQRDTIYVEE